MSRFSRTNSPGLFADSDSNDGVKNNNNNNDELINDVMVYVVCVIRHGQWHTRYRRFSGWTELSTTALRAELSWTVQTLFKLTWAQYNRFTSWTKLTQYRRFSSWTELNSVQPLYKLNWIEHSTDAFQVELNSVLAISSWTELNTV